MGLGKDIPDKSNEQPNKPKRPSNCVVASNALPVKDEVEGELLSGDERSEEYQDNSGDIVSQL